MDNEEKVMQVFIEADKPLRASDIADISGLDKKEIDKVVKKLKKEEKIISPKRCYYEPKR